MGCHKYTMVNNAAGKRRSGPDTAAPLVDIPQPDAQDNDIDIFIDPTEIDGFNSTNVQETLSKLGFLKGKVPQWC